MEALSVSTLSPFPFSPKFSLLHSQTLIPKSVSNFPLHQLRISLSSSNIKPPSAISSIESAALVNSTESGDEKFDWFAHWYPIMPVCDLDKRAPHAKKVMGLDIVVWWDRNEKEWKVFDDSCPHRLAPLSEGRIDQWGRLQCVYHGWCFNGQGHCKFIPQAPPDGPPIHNNKKACVAVYPTTVVNGIVWFWPNSDPQYKDILTKKKPHHIPELDDPTYTTWISNRDIAYGYEVLIENLMDPAHLPYAHYGIMDGPIVHGPRLESVKRDREGGRPLDFSVQKLDINGFTAKQQFGDYTFVAPCLFYGFTNLGGINTSEVRKQQKRVFLIFYCIPVGPGQSRLISTFPQNFGLWINRIVPRWMFHVGHNLVIDSDLYLLHIEERRIMDAGNSKWQKACFVPTKSDAFVVGFRKWLIKYANGQINWVTETGQPVPLLPTPPKEQLLDRYWTHVVNCSSCRKAYKGLNVLEVALQVISVVSIATVAVAKHGLISTISRIGLVSFAISCFVASKWLSHYIYKNFHFHDYNHAFR